MAHSKSEIRKAKNLLSKYAPKGEQLAYINPKEANLLKKMGGAGKDVNVSGIKSYYYDAAGVEGATSGGSRDSGGYDSNGSNNDNAPTPQPASFRSINPDRTPAPKSMLSQAGSGIVNYIKTGGTIGLIARTIGKVFKNIGGRVSQVRTSYNPMNIQPRNKPITGGGGNGGGDNTPPAMNVGGRIIKLSPTTAEISQSSATDASPYDNRKTKAKGRSMMIQTSSRGINRNNTLTLGKPSLLGA
jgi:hypothetical protein